MSVLLHGGLGDRFWHRVVLATMIRSREVRGGELRVLTSVGACRVKLAAAASTTVVPGNRMVQVSHRTSDWARGMALPNAKWNWSDVKDTDRCRLAGFLNTGSVAHSEDNGSGSTPLIYGLRRWRCRPRTEILSEQLRL